MTVREDIAQVRKGVNSVNLDVRLTNKFIYNKIQDVAKLIIKREAETRKLYKSTELFTTLSCVNLIKDELKNCSNIYIPNCTQVMRSEFKLPKAYLSNTGSILNVYSVDRSVQFFQTTPSGFVNISKREFKGKQKYFWIENDYLIIPDSYITQVGVTGLFIDNTIVDVLNGIECSSILESNSTIPDGLRYDVIRTAISEIAGITRRIPEDESPDANANKLN